MYVKFCQTAKQLSKVDVPFYTPLAGQLSGHSSCSTSLAALRIISLFSHSRIQDGIALGFLICVSLVNLFVCFLTIQISSV